MSGALVFIDSTTKKPVWVSAADPLPVTGGGGGGGGGGAVTVANGADVTQGATADAAYTSGSGTVVSVLKGIFGKITNGAGTAAAATRVTYASDGATVPTSDTGLLTVLSDAYETVAASQTDQILGASGAVGDFLAGLLIVPATTSPGAVSIKDGNGSSITVFTGGASSVTNLVPFFVPIGAKCVNATTPGWKVTTSTNVSVIGTGNFT